MHKRLAGLAVVGTFAILAVPALASASSLTSAQVQAILGILESFGADASTIASVQTALTGQPSSTPSSCVNLSQNLTLGDTDATTNGAVAQLQTFLQNQGYFTYTGPKGYYGYITATAVGKYQTAHGLVSSQNDSGYGITGPETRSSMTCGNKTAQTSSAPGNNAVIFSPSVTSGAAPLTVSFTVNNYDGVPNAMVDFGDGTAGPLMNFVSAVSKNQDELGHTYTNPGTYTAEFKNSSGDVLASQTITVTSGNGNNASSSVTLSATPTSGAVPLSVDFSGWNQQETAQYTIDFGDGSGTGLGGWCGPTNRCTATHTYNTPGTYTARLVANQAPVPRGCYLGGGGPCVVPSSAPTVSSVTVTVTGS